MTILEHWVGDVLTVDYNATGGVHYFRGFDQWRAVVDKQGNLYGWLMLSALQFDIKDCWDNDGHMIETLEKNLVFTAGS
jgi:hypothetical protein